MAIIESLDKNMVKQYYLAGKQKGREEGRKEGREEGREEMRQEMEERLKDAIASALAQGLSISQIASIFKVEEDWVRTMQKEE
jgi:predicted transposase YdaD